MSKEIEFLYKTKGGASPEGKPKVYFTCHPDDFDSYFKKICEDIFKTHDCAIYYTGDMTAALTDENNLVDLERMNLFVIPVTLRLLSQPNRAMDSDFRFAMDKHIPILPFMMELGIDEFYGKPDKFGELQYINPYSVDLTEIRYEDKLKKYLGSVLISDELAKRIRNAFDAYIFLSYRKIDRKYANDLMRIIHNNPECRDIAIWFDEFLTPGESFKKNIERILKNSKLFTLLVTPNLPMPRENGEDNYVVKTEYPEAKKRKELPIIPVEMRNTNRKILNKKFEELPECVDARNDKEFRERLLESLKKAAISGNKDDPEHIFLIGLAYLNGIDVEVNKEFALKLFKKAHESGVIEATKQLSEMYVTSNGVEYDIYKAATYELEVISKLKNAGTDVHLKKRLVSELIDMGDICTYGIKEKMEPSPGKTLSIHDAISYYREAVSPQEEIINTSEEKENDIRSIRKYLSVLCNILRGWKAWTNLTYDEVIEYYNKYAKYSAYLGRTSDYAEDIFYWRESNYSLLNELRYDSADYETVLNETVNAARAAIMSECGNNDFWRVEERVKWLNEKLSKLDENAQDAATIIKRADLLADLAAFDNKCRIWQDYDRLLDILYNNGVCYYRYLKDYSQVNRWLHKCYIDLKRFGEIFPENMEKLNASVRAVYDKGYNQYKFKLHLVCSGSVNAIYYLIKHPNTPSNNALISEMMSELVENCDKDDVFIRDAIIPGLSKMIEASN